jgi:L-ascorbate metabolism protein UlaG (beta-lactamase superfamily)
LRLSAARASTGIAALAAAAAVALTGMAVLLIASVALAGAPENSAPEGFAPPPSEMRENCPGLVAERPRLTPATTVTPAALRLAALDPGKVRLTFIGHASFLIESPQGVRVVTDYNDYLRSPVVPDIVTMNHAHDTHFSEHPDPAIKYVLRGWGPSVEEPAAWDIRFGDVRVRNVPTNIRDWNGGTERYGNSIFIFEIANVCIAHLGHLHHTLTQPQLDAIGRVDVVMAPVDGSYTLDLDGMMEVLTALKAPLIIPMHFFGWYALERFLDRAKEQWPVERAEVPSVVVAKTTLPKSPQVLVLPGF